MAADERTAGGRLLKANFGKDLMKLLILFIRNLLHMLLGVGPCCRFSPTCSQRLIQVVEEKKGFGVWVKQLINCHPIGNKV